MGFGLCWEGLSSGSGSVHIPARVSATDRGPLALQQSTFSLSSHLHAAAKSTDFTDLLSFFAVKVRR